MQDSAPVSPDVAHQAYTFLFEMLSWPPLAGLRSHYVLLCLNNLKQHTSSVMALRLLRGLMDMSPQKRKKMPGVEVQTTLDLLESHDLLTLFFNDLDHFKASSRTALSQYGAAAAQLDVKNAVLVGKFPYMQQIKERLMFLDHVLGSTPFVLSIPQLTSFWKDLVVAALVPEERDEAFTWLEHTRAGQAQKSQPASNEEDGALHLFMELVPAMRVDNLSKEGFGFFDFFFRYINFKLHKLTQVENKYVYQKYPFRFLILN